MKLEFTSDQVEVQLAADGAPTRTITAVAVPYAPAFAYAGNNGRKVSFAPGSMPTEGPAPKVFMYHDSTKPVGIVAERVDTPEAMLASMKISKTTLGDEALTLAADGVFSVSVGVDIIEAQQLDDGTTLVLQADWRELSLVPLPAFSESQILDVAASATLTNEGEENADDPDTTTESESTPEETQMSEIVEAAEAPEKVQAGVLFAQPKREFAMPTPGEYMAALHIGGETFARVREAYESAVKANQSAFEFAAGDEATSNVPGLLPTPVLAPLVQNLNFIRPTFELFGPRALPNGQGKSFIRPTITTHTSAAQQMAEFDAVSAQTMVIADNLVDRITVAGQVTLDMQTIDFTSPAAMGLILQDLQGEYLLATDAIAVSGLDGGAVDNTIAWDGTTGSSLQAAIYSAAYEAAIATRFNVDTLVCSAAAWKAMGSLVDDVNRPIFPAVGAPNLGGYNTLGAGDASKWSGMNPLGLNIVVDPQLDASNIPHHMFVVNSQRGFEVYESQRGMLSVDNPGKLSRTFSFFGYAATFAAIPDLVQLVTVTSLTPA